MVEWYDYEFGRIDDEDEVEQEGEEWLSINVIIVVKNMISLELLLNVVTVMLKVGRNNGKKIESRRAKNNEN